MRKTIREGMKRTPACALILVLIVGVVGCRGPAEGGASASGCPENTTRSEVTESLSDGATSETREDAIRAGLRDLGKLADAEEIKAGVIASASGSDGSEQVEVRASDGVVITMTLVPQMPGWRVEGATWCAPNES
jgi:hypothetical protein